MKPEIWHTALIALGANLGEPQRALAWAIGELTAFGTLGAISQFHLTAPVGGPPGQPDYLNAALSLSTLLPPEALLDALLEIERRYGRVRRERWGARVLDLDLIAYDALVQDTPRLTLPHPRAWERYFVLLPLSEVAPDYAHPQTRETVAQALARVVGK
ncbi:2-amino-4-hydroxy-6-hydroxymethyldihydropteridine diphosphokinase [Deinococcus sp.]|uniref:2-amino-4-hydroxy-6- hydroxymethyldihydropteridine diphosphokinase n=1 Tax=Deinococcus sp. TaxID=47478 RepID=UPI003B5CDC7B